MNILEAKKMLTAAALTYVAGMLPTLLSLLRIVLVVLGNDRGRDLKQKGFFFLFKKVYNKVAWRNNVLKAFFRKHRFKIVLTFLVIVFVYICFYMLWVHVPLHKA